MIQNFSIRLFRVDDISMTTVNPRQKIKIFFCLIGPLWRSSVLHSQNIVFQMGCFLPSHYACNTAEKKGEKKENALRGLSHTTSTYVCWPALVTWLPIAAREAGNIVIIKHSHLPHTSPKWKNRSQGTVSSI